MSEYQYCLEDFLQYEEVGDYVLLSFERNDDEPPDAWVDGEGMLDDLLPLREAILAGDYRALYLAWLMGVADEELLADEETEPPLPAGLGTLNNALETFMDLFPIDQQLLQGGGEREWEIKENGRAYDEAVTQVGKLNQLAEFQARVEGLAAKYGRRPAFV